MKPDPWSQGKTGKQLFGDQPMRVSCTGFRNVPHTESQIRDYVAKQLKSLGIYHIKNRAQYGGQRGIPDFFICAGGFFWGVELKTDNENPTKLQAEELRMIELSGGRTIVIRGMQAAINFIGYMRNYGKDNE